MSAPGVSSDEGLRAFLARLAGGDRQALADLYDSLARDLYGLALYRSGSAALAEEAVQELFARLAAGRTDLARVKHPRAYLFTSLRRVVDELARRERLESGQAELPEPSIDGPSERSIDAARAAAALRELPPKLREALYLRYLLERPLAEVARCLGVPLFTAASRCRLGLARLRARLQGRTP